VDAREEALRERLRALSDDQRRHFYQIRRLEADMNGKLRGLQRYYVPESVMLPLACKVFGIYANEEALARPKRLGQLAAFRDRIQTLTKDYFGTLGPHGYSALNVLTDFASFPEGMISRESRINRMQSLCGEWMQDFPTAIEQPSFSFDQYLRESQASADFLLSIQ
jgi:hypothetical protein